MTSSSATDLRSPLRRLAGLKTLRLALAVALAVVVAYQVLRPRKQRLVASTTIEVGASPLPQFSRQDPGRTRFGKLEYRGGLVLTSPSRAFGGWSALAVDGRGRRFLAISDTGAWLTGELTYDGGRPTGVADAVIGPLLGRDGAPFTHAYDRDTEGLAIVSGTIGGGEALISFEGNDRIGRFPVDAGGVGPLESYVTLPPEARRLTFNVGLESVCIIPAGPAAGAVVTLVERFPGTTDTHTGWIRGSDPGADGGSGWRRLAITNINDYDLTDCHGLADGGMLVLERRFHARDWIRGPRMRLRRFSAAELVSGGTMAGETLIDAGPGENVDNMEGLAVHTDAGGATVVTLISDDNFNHGLQRTLLLQFALPPTTR